MNNVLFLCTGNTCRSQMAEGFLREKAGDRFTALSGGLEPGEAIHPMAVEVMKEIGIDIGNQHPKNLDRFLGREHIRYLIVVCDRAQQSCPRIWPGLADENRLYWPLDDPARAEGTEEERLAVFRRVRDELGAKIDQWLTEDSGAYASGGVMLSK
jgi:arsenate reductase